MAKDNLSLLANAQNVFSMSQSAIDTYRIDDEDVAKIHDTMSLFLKKTKNHFANRVISKHVDNDFKNYDFIRLPKYPLPAAFNKTTRRIVINTHILGKRDILNIDPRDIFATFVYAYTCAYYSLFTLEDKYSEVIADYMGAIYIRMFAKKYGLVGSYQAEIPKLRLLVNYHTFVSFFDMMPKAALQKAERLAKIRKESFDVNLLDYNVRDTRTFIKLLDESGTLHGINVHVFASTAIRLFNGPANIPLFEDGMRFMSTIAGSTSISNIYPNNMPKFQPRLYEKILVMLEKLFSK